MPGRENDEREKWKSKEALCYRSRGPWEIVLFISMSEAQNVL